jgi:hypothetical protein
LIYARLKEIIKFTLTYYKNFREILMKLKNRILSAVALSIFSQYAYSIPFAFEGRSLGMGGVGVATANIATAAWANPAMLTNQHESDDFSLLFGVGAFARDPDELLVDIQDFQDANDAYNAAVDSGDGLGAGLAAIDMSTILSGIEGKDVALDVSGLAAMGIAFETFAMAISVRGDAIGAGTVTDTACELGVDPGCDIPTFIADVEDPNKNILNLEGIFTTELGVSFAKSFSVYDRKFSVGIKPKLVNVEAFTFTESIQTIDGLDDLRNEDNRSEIGDFVSVDLGFAYDLSESFRLGLHMTNLFPAEFDVAGQTLNFDLGARLGVAYHNSFLTVAVDYDLIENEPILANPTFGDLKTQYIGLGAELNAFDFMQIRGGIAKNLASNVSSGSQDPIYTVGLGFWLGFNLDLAATISDHSVGGFLQTGFRF